MTTKEEKDRMKAVDGKGRSFEVLGNTEIPGRDMGETAFEELVPGDLFASYEGLELNIHEGTFINFVLESPRMVGDKPTLKALPINLKRINALNARPLNTSKENDGIGIEDVEVTTSTERKAKDFVNGFSKLEPKLGTVNIGALFGAYNSFLGKKATEKQARALFEALNENYEFIDG